MRHWNYRVVRRTVKGAALYGIHEVYYDDAGKPESVSVRSIPIEAESLEEVTSELDMQRRALESPVLDYDNIPAKEEVP